MVQPARVFELWRRLYSRFLIEPFPADRSETPGISTTIQPITNADELLGLNRARSLAGVSVGAGIAGGTLAQSVPSGERWKVQSFQAIRTSGDNLLDGFGFFDASRNVTMRCEGPVATPATELSLLIPGNIILEESDAWVIFTDGTGAGASEFTTRAWYVEEALF